MFTKFSKGPSETETMKWNLQIAETCYTVPKMYPLLTDPCYIRVSWKIGFAEFTSNMSNYYTKMASISIFFKNIFLSAKKLGI